MFRREIKMKKYIKLFKTGILNSSAFKMDFYFGFITIPIQVIISWYFWKYANLENVGREFTLNSIVLYFLIVNILSIIYSPAMYVCYESMELINSGNIITWMTRPIDIRLLKLFEKVGNFFVISIVPIALYSFGNFYKKYKFVCGTSRNSIHIFRVYNFIFCATYNWISKLLVQSGAHFQRYDF